jgi:hypothetical protein
MKVVINTCYGGFGLSHDAFIRYKNESGNTEIPYYGIPRNDPILVSIVEELGEDSWGRWASLKIVDIPDGIEWDIEEYDGSEWVAETHRTWS